MDMSNLLVTSVPSKILLMVYKSCLKLNSKWALGTQVGLGSQPHHDLQIINQIIKNTMITKILK